MQHISGVSTGIYLLEVKCFFEAAADKATCLLRTSQRLMAHSGHTTWEIYTSTDEFG